MITTIVGAILPLLLKLIEYFVTKSNLSMDEKKSFLGYIKQANAVMQTSVQLRKSIGDQRDRLDKQGKKGP